MILTTELRGKSWDSGEKEESEAPLGYYRELIWSKMHTIRKRIENESGGRFGGEELLGRPRFLLLG